MCICRAAWSGAVRIASPALTTPPSLFPGLYLICRTILVLRGLCFAVGLDVTLTDMWRPFAEATLADLEGLETRAAMNAAIDGGEPVPAGFV